MSPGPRPRPEHPGKAGCPRPAPRPPRSRSSPRTTRRPPPWTA